MDPVRYCHSALWADADTVSATYFHVVSNSSFTTMLSFDGKDCNVNNGKCVSINEE